MLSAVPFGSAGQTTDRGSWILRNSIVKRSQKDRRTLKVALWGCGGVVETYYAPILKKMRSVFSVEYLCDPNEANVKQMQSEFPLASSLKSLQELPANLDGIIIATPPAVHAGYAIEALSAGFPVLCEVPVCLTQKDTDRIAQLSSTSGKPCMAALIYRYFPALRTIKDLLDDEMLGTVLSFDFRCGKKFDWNIKSTDFFSPAGDVSAGVMTHYGFNLIDLAHWFFGPVQQVEVFDNSSGGPESMCRISLIFSNGIRGQIRLSWQTDTICGLSVYGDRASIEWEPDNAATFTMTSHGGRRVSCGAVDRLDAAIPYNFGSASDTLAGYSWLLSDFADSIFEETTPQISAADAIASSKLLQQCYSVRQPIVPSWLVELKVGGAP